MSTRFRKVILVLATSLFLTACGGSGGDTPANDDPDSIPEPQTPTIDPNEGRDIVEIDGAYAYKRDSRYATILNRCASIERSADACSLEILPFVIQDNPVPTIDDVMSRVLVTHDWMGERFEALLRSGNDSLVRMFGSVTTILIGSTVRPSNYWTGTGGIELDPNYLWMSIDEKMTVSVDEDFRSGFGSELQFRFYQARLKDGVNLYTSFNLTNDDTRTFDDIRLPTLRLLYHELAHANDFLPRNAASFLDSSLIPSEALDGISDYWLSPKLVSDRPLNSVALKGLAGVRYRGFTATESEKNMTATFLGGEITGDGSAKFYSYSTIREDFATLIDTAMLKAVFDVDLATGFVDVPSSSNVSGCDYTVGWGTRNRLSDPLVLDRARIALESLFGPSDGLDQFIDDQLGTADPMTPGRGWCAERDLRAPAASDVAGTLSQRRAQRAPQSGHGAEMSDMDRHAWADRKRRP